MTARISYGVEMAAGRRAMVRAVRSGAAVRTEEVAENGLPRMSREVEEGKAALAVALPAQDSFVRWLQAPFRSAGKARKVLPSLLDNQLPFPVEQCQHVFLDLRPDGPAAVAALAVAARLEDFAAFLDHLRAGQMDPPVVDHEGLALWTQALAEGPGAGSAPRAVLHLADDHAVLAAGRGDQLQVVQAIRIGAGPAEATAQIAGRVIQALRAHFSAEAEAVAFLLTGSAAAQPGVVAALREALHHPPAFAVAAEPALFLARAVAARALTPGPLRCNLRVGAFEHASQTRALRAAERRAVWGAMAAGLALIAVNVLWQQALGRREAGLERRLAALAADLNGGARVPRGQEALVAERAVAEREARMAPMIEAFEPSLAGLLAGTLAACRQHDLILTAASLAGNAVSLSGRGRSWDDCDAVAKVLTHQGWSVDLDRGAAGTDELVPFTLRGVR